MIKVAGAHRDTISLEDAEVLSQAVDVRGGLGVRAAEDLRKHLI